MTAAEKKRLRKIVRRAFAATVGIDEDEVYRGDGYYIGAAITEACAPLDARIAALEAGVVALRRALDAERRKIGQFGGSPLQCTLDALAATAGLVEEE